MSQYENLLSMASGLGLRVIEMEFESNAKGIIKGKKIGLHKSMTVVEKSCVLSEEIGHDQTGVGNILDQNTVLKRKQERRAREWAHKCLIPLDKIIEAHHARVSGRYDLAEYLEVTEQFLQDAIDRYTAKHGVYVRHSDRYLIWFEPLGVIEMFID